MGRSREMCRWGMGSMHIRGEEIVVKMGFGSSTFSMGGRLYD